MREENHYFSHGQRREGKGRKAGLGGGVGVVLLRFERKSPKKVYGRVLLEGGEIVYIACLGKQGI